MGKLDDELKTVTEDAKNLLSREYMKFLLSLFTSEEEPIKILIEGCSQNRHSSNFESTVHEAVSCIKIMSERMNHSSILLDKCHKIGLSQVLETFLVAKAILKDINIILIHCKESSKIYGNCLFQLSAELSMLFKSTCQALKIALDLFESFNPPEYTETEVAAHFDGTIDEVLDAVLILNDIDLLPFANTLRSLSRILAAKKIMVNDQLDHSKLFSTICHCTKDKLNYTWSLIEDAKSYGQRQVDGKKCLKATKVVRFLLGMLLQLVKEYKHQMHGGSTKMLIEVLFILQSLTPTAVNVHFRRFAPYVEFANSVLCVIEPMLSELLDARDFVRSIRCVDGHVTDCQIRNANLSELLLLTSILSCLAKSNDHFCEQWMEKPTSDPERYPSIIEKIFILFEKCIELNHNNHHIPNVDDKNSAVRHTSLYEYSCLTISAFMATATPSVYDTMEFVLVKNVFSSISRSMLAGDILCFIARKCHEKLCSELVSYFSYLNCAMWKVTTSRSAWFLRCSDMLRRLFMVLSDANKLEFMKIFNPKTPEYLPIWSSIDICALPEDERGKFVIAFISTTLENVEKHDRNGQDPLMFLTFKVWENCLVTADCFSLLSENEAHQIFDILTRFIQSGNIDEIDEQFFCLTLKTFCTVLEHIDMESLMKTLETVSMLLEYTNSELLQLQCCIFLSKLKNFQFSSNRDYSLACLSRSYRNLLSTESVYIRHVAMKSLKEFAEVTSYTDIICECLPESMNEIFSQFLSKNRMLPDLSTEDKESKTTSALALLCESYEKTTVEKTLIEQQPVSPVYELNSENQPNDKEYTQIDQSESQVEAEKEIEKIEHDLTIVKCNIKEFLRKHDMKDSLKLRLKLLLNDVFEI